MYYDGKVDDGSVWWDRDASKSDLVTHMPRWKTQRCAQVQSCMANHPGVLTVGELRM